MSTHQKDEAEAGEGKINIRHVFGSAPWLKPSDKKHFRAKVFKSGNSLAVRIPATIALAPEAVNVDGEVSLAQTGFGIVPYSILAGALQVQDPVAIRFRVRARRLSM